MDAPEEAPENVPGYPALQLTQNEHRFYFTTIPIDDLFPYCFVARRNEDPTAGFQRVLNEERADDIAKYLAAGTGSIPSNIVLSAQSTADLRYNTRTKLITFKRLRSGFLVLDGQHRLWGYQKCQVKHRVPVAIYESLTRAQEARLFIDINTTQKGVPAALLLDIKRLAEIESQQETTLRSLFDRLSTDSRSPLHGRLSAATSAPNRISRVTFNRSLSPILGTQIVSTLPPDHQYQLIRNYLNAFDAELAEKELLVRSAFFEAMFDIFDEVVRATLKTASNAKQEAIQETIRNVAKLDYSTVGGGQSKLTKKALVSAMLAALRQNVRLSGDLL